MPTPLPSARDLPGDPIAEQDLARAYAAADDLVNQARTVWWALRHDPKLEVSTADRIGPMIAGFAARQRTLGRDRLAAMTPDDARGFIWARTARGAEPAIATVHLRRTALRILTRTLADFGEAISDPTAGINLPPRTRVELRPLDDDEIGLVRIAASGKIRARLLAMATLALAESTATTGEIALVRRRDIDLDTQQVRLPGAGAIRERVGTLTPWGAGAIARFAAANDIDADAPLVYGGRAVPGSQPSQATIVSRLSRLLGLASLDAPDVRPTSIRLWAPARDLAVGDRIEQVANRLGLHSLDVTAALLDHRWQGR